MSSLAAADYLNMTVSNKKALATLDTIHKRTFKKVFLINDFINYFVLLLPYTCVLINALYSVK